MTSPSTHTPDELFDAIKQLADKSNQHGDYRYTVTAVRTPDGRIAHNGQPLVVYTEADAMSTAAFIVTGQRGHKIHRHASIERISNAGGPGFSVRHMKWAEGDSTGIVVTDWTDFDEGGAA